MITDELKAAILEAINLDDWDLGDDTVASQVPGWDSLSHVSVIAAVEERFAVRFSIRDLLAMKNLGDMQKLIDFKLQAKGSTL